MLQDVLDEMIWIGAALFALTVAADDLSSIGGHHVSRPVGEVPCRDGAWP